MPELPEVEGVRQTLENLIVGKKIHRVWAEYPSIVREPQPFMQFAQALEGESFCQILRKGKFLILQTDHYAIVSHLRMEGKYILAADKDEPYTKHTHVFFTFSDGSELRYADVRKFGTMHLTPRDEYMQLTALQKLAPDVIADAFHTEYFYQKVHHRQRAVKNLLLDQEIAAGLGNIYADEVLFRVGIHPKRMGTELTRAECKKITEQAKAVLNLAIALGGSTIRTYQNAQGRTGTFQNELKVYGQAGQPCAVCGAPIEKLKISGRGTHFCPQCQK